ncbi:hypothetical protein IAR55_001808 [Kwoniella newhampshirensis]|uniref:Xylanolytic transcriptional activator regulatory domain-containing protein n=1 Tax=Kwoniella newhampshirensis TaxID=1651941 RepID=A0AAW0Z332_9TREE
MPWRLDSQLDNILNTPAQHPHTAVHPGIVNAISSEPSYHTLDDRFRLAPDSELSASYASTPPNRNSANHSLSLPHGPLASTTGSNSSRNRNPRCFPDGHDRVDNPHDLVLHLDPLSDPSPSSIAHNHNINLADYNEDDSDDADIIAEAERRPAWKSSILSEVEVAELLDKFFELLNPRINLLDPKLHTFKRLRTRAPLLLDVILAVTTRFFRPEIATSLGDHASVLVCRATLDGLCSIELIQCLCIMVYWKNAVDQSAWMRLGMAIRMGYQMRLHEQIQCGKDVPEKKRRIAVDRERTWYCLACFDSLNIFSLPPTIRSYELPSVQRWADRNSDLQVPWDYKLAFSILLPQLETHAALVQRPGAMRNIEQAEDELIALEKAYGLRGLKTFALPEALIEDLELFAQWVLIRLRTAQYDLEPNHARLMALFNSVQAFSDCMEKLAISGALLYLQDAACAWLSGTAGVLHPIIREADPTLRKRCLELLVHMHTYCQSTARKLSMKDKAPAYIAQYLEKLLRRIQSESRAVTRAPTPNQEDYMSDYLFNDDFLKELDSFVESQTGQEIAPLDDARFDAYWQILQGPPQT